MAPRKKKAQAWVSSEGKKLLERDIRKKFVTVEMPVDAVYNMHRAEYDECGVSPAEARRLFDGRLKAAFKRGSMMKKRSEEEALALKSDRLTHPRPLLDAHGTPQWEGSIAQKYMKQDIAHKLHLGKTSAEFCMTRPEYQVYGVERIGKKIEQEVKLRKWKENYPQRIKSLPTNP